MTSLFVSSASRSLRQLSPSHVWPRCSAFQCLRSCSSGASSTQSNSPTVEITDDDRKRVFVYGTGNTSCLMAAGIRLGPNAPRVTLLASNERRIEEFQAAGNIIRLKLPTGGKVKVHGVDIEILPKRSHSEDYNTRIDPNDPNSALKFYEIKHRLHRESTVIVRPRAMGILENIIASHFPIARLRPTFRLASESHIVSEADSHKDSYHNDMLAGILSPFPKNSWMDAFDCEVLLVSDERSFPE
ncbi:hypothetical protein VTL71DRAFT_6218 [Oculimacula yallundae]|uniref:Uncharacterized protein n=1 Tax=Oculimacula yallundae TaxID=86028 RepID=A0ABR4BZR2_9HELO